MVNLPASAKGFSLIELMVVMAIAGILALTVMPFTQAWVDETRVINANNAVIQAWSQAKSLALRNPSGTTDLSPAAEILIDNSTIFVCPVACDAATKPDAWSIAIANGAQVTFTSPVATAIGLSNRGAALSAGVEIAAVEYSVTKGAAREDNKLY